MRRRRDEEGTSLAEVLVAMVLTMGLLAIILSATISTNQSVRQTNARTDDLAGARLGLYTLAKSLRAAGAPIVGEPSFVSGDGNEVTFYSNIGNADTATGVIGAPDQYTYEIETGADGTGSLVETVLSADPGSGPDFTYTGLGDSRSRTLARNVLDEAGEPTFVFTDSADVPLGVLQASGDRALTAANLEVVTAVTVRLRVQTDTNPDVSPTVLVNRVRVSDAYFKLNVGGS